MHPGPTTHMALASLVTHGLAAIADGSAARLLPAGARGADLGTLQPAFEVASFEICTGGNERTDLHFGCAPRGRIRQPRVRRMPPRRHTLTCVRAVLRMQATSREWRVPAPSKPSRPAASRRGATPASKPSWTALGSRGGSPTPRLRRMVEVPWLSVFIIMIARAATRCPGGHSRVPRAAASARERSALAAPRPRPRRGCGGALVPAQASPMSPALATQTSLRPRIGFTVAGSIGAGTLFLEYLRR